jgi:hypothetical protein
MNAFRDRWGARAVLLLSFVVSGGLAAAAPAEAEGGTRLVHRSYRVYLVERTGLDSLVQEFCSQAGDTQCVGHTEPGYISLLTSDELHAKFAVWLKTRDVPPPTQVFHVHLFAADNAPAGAEPIPSALTPVLKDLAGFLPFRSFHLISTGMVRTSRDGRIDLGGDPPFVVDLRFAGDPSGGKPLQIEQFELVRRQMVPAEGGAVTTANLDVVRTSFSMNVGETVVVGTSKLNGGDKALVVLLTAAK